jgi:hypothetical protein
MNARLRSWAKRAFYDPEPALRALRALEVDLSATSTPELIRRLGTNKLKSDREARDALIFAFGMRTVVGAPVLVAPGETEDCDFITVATVDDTSHYTCVQLKELAPEDLNPSQTLEQLIRGLQDLPKSDTVLAIHLNRRGSIPLSDLVAGRVPFSELWFFWASDPTLTRWHLFGDAMAAPALHSFDYPE